MSPPNVKATPSRFYNLESKFCTVSSYASEKEERAGDNIPRMAFRGVLVLVEVKQAVEEIFDLKVTSRMKK